MKRWIMTACLLVMATSAAFGQECRYQHDTGSLGSAIGPSSGRSFIALNQFTVGPGFSGEIAAVELGIQNVNFVSRPLTAGLWSDPNQDGNPQDGVLLGTSAVTASTAGFQMLPLTTPVQVGGSGTIFFVGVFFESGPGFQQIAVRSNLHGLSWLRERPDPFDPNDLSPLNSSSHGTFAIRAICNPPLPVESANWGMVKATYRD